MSSRKHIATEAVLFLAEGFEEMEAATALDILRRGGVNVLSVSIGASLVVSGSHNIALTADALFEDVDFFGARALIFPGGLGCERYYPHGGLRDLTTRFADSGRLIAAICAAPAFLAELGVLSGRRATCYPGANKDADSDVSGVT